MGPGDYLALVMLGASLIGTLLGVALFHPPARPPARRSSDPVARVLLDKTRSPHL